MKKNNKGFTLIEMMVVVAIIAGTAALVIPRLGNRNNKTKAILREITILSRQLHTKAKLNGTIYRLVIDMKDGADGKGTQEYWVEKSSNSTLIRTDDPEEDNPSKEPKPPSDFAPDSSVMKKPSPLPNEMYFAKVELTRLSEPVTRGKAYIHYMPQGLVEESAIHLKSGKDRKWTISIHPLTGKAEVISEETSLQEIRSQ